MDTVAERKHAGKTCLLERLLQDAQLCLRDRGLRVLVALVPHHTGDEPLLEPVVERPARHANDPPHATERRVAQRRHEMHAGRHRILRGVLPHERICHLLQEALEGAQRHAGRGLKLFLHERVHLLVLLLVVPGRVPQTFNVVHVVLVSPLLMQIDMPPVLVLLVSDENPALKALMPRRALPRGPQNQRQRRI